MKTVNLKDFSRELGELSKTQIKTLTEITYEALWKSIPDLVAASPVDTGQYAASWSVERPSEFQMWIGNYAPHAPIIEHGARPYSPPIGPLLEWARRVLQKGPAIDTESGGAIMGPAPRTYDPDQYPEDVRRLAFAVQAKIRERGMEPRHILENQIPKIIERVVAEFKAQGAK